MNVDAVSVRTLRYAGAEFAVIITDAANSTWLDSIESGGAHGDNAQSPDY